jgi:hypothetical protein
MFNAVSRRVKNQESISEVVTDIKAGVMSGSTHDNEPEMKLLPSWPTAKEVPSKKKQVTNAAAENDIPIGAMEVSVFDDNITIPVISAKTQKKASQRKKRFQRSADQNKAPVSEIGENFHHSNGKMAGDGKGGTTGANKAFYVNSSSAAALSCVAPSSNTISPKSIPKDEPNNRRISDGLSSIATSNHIVASKSYSEFGNLTKVTDNDPLRNTDCKAESPKNAIDVHSATPTRYSAVSPARSGKKSKAAVAIPFLLEQKAKISTTPKHAKTNSISTNKSTRKIDSVKKESKEQETKIANSTPARSPASIRIDKESKIIDRKENQQPSPTPKIISDRSQWPPLTSKTFSSSRPMPPAKPISLAELQQQSSPSDSIASMSSNSLSTTAPSQELAR